MGVLTSRLADKLSLLRPLHLVPVCTVYLHGFARNFEEWPIPLTGRQILSLVVLLWLYGGLQYAERARGGPQLRGASSDPAARPGRSGSPPALFLHMLLTAMALAGAAWLSTPSWYVALAIALLGYARTVPPWLLLRRPYGDLFGASALYGTCAYMFGYLCGHGAVQSGFTASFPYLFVAGALYLLAGTAPFDSFSRTVPGTLVGRLGGLRVARWALGWYLAALLVAVYTLDVLFILALLPCAPLFVLSGRDPERYGPHAIRWSVALLSAAACLFQPWYAAALVVLLLLARLIGRRPGSRGVPV